MAKVTAICGGICCGKTSYANKLRKKSGGVLLSVDEVMLSLFGQDAGELHDEYSKRAKRYLLSKAAELASGGVNVILDWGFWRADERRSTREYFSRLGIEYELYYIDIDANEWRRRVERRNKETAASEDAGAYFIDEGLARKFASRFEPPAPGEADAVIPAAET